MPTEEENIDRVIASIKKVPEKHLLIIELANKVPIKDGDFDPRMLMDIQPEINLAMAEAVSYGGATINAVAALASLCRKSNDIALRPLERDDLEEMT